MTPAVIAALEAFAAASKELAEAFEAAGVEPPLHPEVAAAIIAPDPVELLLRAAALFWRHEPDRIIGPSTKRPVVTVRHAIAYTLRNRYNWSFPRIGEALNRDHSTIMHACEAVAMWTGEEREKYVGRLNDYLDAKPGDVVLY